MRKKCRTAGTAARRVAASFNPPPERRGKTITGTALEVTASLPGPLSSPKEEREIEAPTGGFVQMRSPKQRWRFPV